MTPTKSRWAALAVALAVALLAVGGYAVGRAGDSAQPPVGAASVTPTAPAGTPAPSAQDPLTPTITPVPPTKTPIIRPPEPPRTTEPPGCEPTPGPGPLAVPVVSYERTAHPDRLLVHYYIGVPECYGAVDPDDGVQVTETADAVRVRLTRTPPPADADRACIDLALAKTVPIELDRPLDDRAVIDASTGNRVPNHGLTTPQVPPPITAEPRTEEGRR